MLADLCPLLGDIPVDATEGPLHMDGHAVALAILIHGGSADQPARRFIWQAIHRDVPAPRDHDLAVPIPGHRLLCRLFRRLHGERHASPPFTVFLGNWHLTIDTVTPCR